MTTTRTAGTRVLPSLNTPSARLATAAFTAGVACGGVLLALPSDPVTHVAGTSAWWPHLGLAGLAAALLLVAAHRRSAGRGGLLLAPLGRPAWRRLEATMRTRSWRTGLAVPLILLLAYNAFRAGIQVLAGLDPAFTANAWGGPSYAGAMACHYLDLALMSWLVGWLLHRILVPDPGRVVAASAQAAASRPS